MWEDYWRYCVFLRGNWQEQAPKVTHFANFMVALDRNWSSVTLLSSISVRTIGLEMLSAGEAFYRLFCVDSSLKILLVFSMLKDWWAISILRQKKIRKLNLRLEWQLWKNAFHQWCWYNCEDKQHNTKHSTIRADLDSRCQY